MNTINNKVSVKGITVKRLFDQKAYNRVKEAIAMGADPSVIDYLIEKAAKPLFQENKLWKVIKKYLNLDLQIPYITGRYTTAPIVSNLVVTRGKQIVSNQIGGITSSPVTAIALGTNTTAPAAANTALGAEITTNGGARGAATVSQQTTTVTGDTCQWIKTFTFTGSLAITEEGLFDNNSSGGNMLARQTFSAINVANTDTLQITHKIVVS